MGKATTLRKTNVAMENGPFEDVFSIENGDISLLCHYVSSPEGRHELNKKGRSTANSASLSLGRYLGVGRSMPGVASRFAQNSCFFIQGFLEKWHLTKL